MDKLIDLIGYFAILSVAAERLTEIIKNAWLSKLKVNPAVYQLISGSFGAALGYANPHVIPSIDMPIWAMAVITGLAVSGGSSFWNSILSTLSEFKTKMKVTNENVKGS